MVVQRKLLDMRDDEFRSLAREAEKLSFVHKWSAYHHARVCSTKIYRTIKSSDQTRTCAQMAARHYYNKLHPGKFLIDLEPLDSQSFDRLADDVKDRKAYYHVNFKAKLLTRNGPPLLFFAELEGTEGPKQVNMCVELSCSGNLENCDFCTGISHPTGNFIGCKLPC